ncbi:replication-associated recombination protein A [Desulfosporosinus metallidurans]|uniref:ATPase, AAA family n=1 Tax=Desulfosporosinus metallidurans TaxID=1888891 RepID=A0A1Q8QY33_9FIRM|nr:replication-associated recombination protein A [Desulfosporosinus metallidurans]OLN32268.1 ATPase, AAA family [Desulfosporosinus metallidurans]
MDLFSATFDQHQVAPLAERMRPRTLDDYIGQNHILGPGKLLRRAIEADRVSSLILYGPPGTGKTSLAQVIAAKTTSRFVRINAVTSGVKDLREIITQAADDLHLYGKRTLVFCDEVHRFNKGQQDALLPAVEDGTITFIGATTENPFFELNSALLSRSTLFRLELLTPPEIRLGLEHALKDVERGLGRFQVDINSAAWEHWINYANGDLRRALNALELAVLTTQPENGVRHISLDIAEESIQQRAIKFDKAGDNHYDIISAFIKSMRGSDPDAALYWLAVLLEAGEDPRFIMRRIIVHASEDVGLADPTVMLQAHAAANALEWLGLPEARIPLAQAVLAISTAPKSNSAVASIDRALAYVRKHPTGEVPAHLKDKHYSDADKLGHGQNYLYPHSYPNHWVAQAYLPPEIQGETFYVPSEMGQEFLQNPKGSNKER